MNQMSMFAEATAPESRLRSVPVLDEDWHYYTDRAVDVAGYSATMQNPRWECCTAGVWVSLERHFGWKPHRWMAEVFLELPDDERTSWKVHSICATQDEAAKEAAFMAFVARGLLDAFLRGEAVETPGQRRQRAAEEHVAALPEIVAAYAMVAAERTARDELDPDSSEKYVAHRRYLGAKHSADALSRDAESAFYEAHPWREFAEVPHVAR